MNPDSSEQGELNFNEVVFYDMAKGLVFIPNEDHDDSMFVITPHQYNKEVPPGEQLLLV